MHDFALQKDFIHEKSKLRVIESFVHDIDKKCGVIENEQSHLKENFNKMEVQINTNIIKLETRFDSLDDGLKKISAHLSEKHGAIIMRDKFWKSITAFMTVIATLGVADHFFRFISFIIK